MILYVWWEWAKWFFTRAGFGRKPVLLWSPSCQKSLQSRPGGLLISLPYEVRLRKGLGGSNPFIYSETQGPCTGGGPLRICVSGKCQAKLRAFIFLERTWCPNWSHKSQPYGRCALPVGMAGLFYSWPCLTPFIHLSSWHWEVFEFVILILVNLFMIMYKISSSNATW